MHLPRIINPVPVVATLAIVVMLGGCGGGGGSSKSSAQANPSGNNAATNTTVKPNDTQLAATMLLGGTDVSGWIDTGPVDPNAADTAQKKLAKGAGTCAGSPQAADIQSGSAYGHLLSPGSDTTGNVTAQTSVVLVRSVAEAQNDFQVQQSPQYRQCVQSAATADPSTVGANTTLSNVTVAKIVSPDGADDVVAQRIHYVGTTNAVPLDIYQDSYTFLQNRAEVTLAVNRKSLTANADVGPLLALLRTRAKQVMSGTPVAPSSPTGN